jgi:hypothetical protein
MQRNINNKEKKIKNKRKNQRGRQQNSQIVYRNLTLAQLVPDELRCEIDFTMIPTVYFNSVANAGSVSFYANSLFQITSGVTGITAYGTGKFDDYEKYRVETSQITITMGSKEAVNCQHYFLTPTLTNSAITVSDWDEYSNLPYSKRTILGPYVSGQMITALSQTNNLSKFVGPHYKQQDEYAGTVASGTPANPATLVYWILAYYNPQNNTLTTGGITLQVHMKQHVVFYQPIRSIASTMKKQVDRSHSRDSVGRRVITTTEEIF